VLQVHNALVSLEELLRTLLDISKLDAGVLRPDIRTFPIDDVLEPLRVELEPLAAARGLKLRMRRSQDYVRSDPLLLRRILQNLVNNALRYARRGGVLVGCRRRGALLRIEVNDTGPGIAADRREAIWEEFQRGGSLSGEQGGFGLGLSIVRRLAAALDHPVDLASRVGYGSTFSISVPIDVASPADAAGRSENPAPRVGGLDGAEILLVENDQAVAEAMQALLGRWGCGVTIANSGAQALGTLHDLARRPDLIIADLHLDNDENGFDVVRKIQSETSGIVPAFIVTADHSQSVGATAAEIGVEVLRKPIKPAELRALMSHLLA
jgi:CheY-like chemotaxis protein/anti-sigma regulatory factor (Ser/Thr protein kinase)